MALSPRQKSLFIICGVVVLVLAVASPFAWQQFKVYRAESLADTARELMEEGNIEQAWEKARAAYALIPEDPEIARTLAQLRGMADPITAPELWGKIYELTGEEADLMAWYDSAFPFGNAVSLELIVEQMKADFPDSAEINLRLAQWALSQGDEAGGIDLLKKAAAAPEASADIQFAYVQRSQSSEDPAVRQAGIDWLRKMADQEGEIGLRALRVMLRAPGVSDEERRSVAVRLSEHPMAERGDQLTEIMVRQNLDETPIDEVVAEAKKLFALENLEEVVELGRWLNGQNRSADLLEIVDLDTALKREDLFLVWVDAMALTGQWEGLLTVIDRPRLPIDPFVQQLFRARIQAELGKQRLSDLTWNQALIKARDDVTKLGWAYDYADKLGWNMKARDALERLSKNPQTQRLAFERLVELNQRIKDVEALQEVLRRMSDQYPHDANVANDLAYVNLLLGQEVQEAGNTAVNLLQQSEKPFLANVMTLSLAYYLAGNKQAALEPLYTLPIDWDEVRPGWRTVYAAILKANGHTREAESIMEKVNPDHVLPQEYALYRSANG
ncbi:MAG: hypothetical protein AAFX93_07045 [Verrucomicrobiota bacterium]